MAKIHNSFLTTSRWFFFVHTWKGTSPLSLGNNLLNYWYILMWVYLIYNNLSLRSFLSCLVSLHSLVCNCHLSLFSWADSYHTETLYFMWSCSISVLIKYLITLWQIVLPWSWWCQKRILLLLFITISMPWCLSHSRRHVLDQHQNSI